MFGLTPKIGMQLVRKAIESQLKEKTPVFKMVYIATDKKEIYFDIPHGEKIRRYPYTNESVFTTIELMTKKQLKNNTFKIDRVIIDAENNDFTFNVYYRNEANEKLFNTIKL